MAKSKSKIKTRSDKFPLTLHKTGQFCKKINGKLYYFGTDKQTALQRYLEQAAYLHAGKAPMHRPSQDRLSIKILCNLYLDHQESRAEIGEIQPRHVSDQILLLKGKKKGSGLNGASLRSAAGLKSAFLSQEPGVLTRKDRLWKCHSGQAYDLGVPSFRHSFNRLLPCFVSATTALLML